MFKKKVSAINSSILQRLFIFIFYKFAFGDDNLLQNTKRILIMDKYQIGVNAGIVWNILKDNAHWEYEELKKASGLSDRDLNAAIGWLAREDKIDFDIDPNSDRLFLNVNIYIG